MNIHFADKDVQSIQELHRVFHLHNNITFSIADVTNLPRNNTAFVSPSNSLLFMDGGIDHAYSRVMFPGIEQTVKNSVVKLGLGTSKLGRPYLPVGAAMAVEISYKNTWLICAPTMYLPQPVTKTRNAYHSMTSILCVLERLPPSTTLVCPSLCTGYGKMSSAQSAEQMHDAYWDFVVEGRRPSLQESRHPLCCIPTNDVLQQILQSQPDYYQNSEFKDIPPEHIEKVG